MDEVQMENQNTEEWELNPKFPEGEDSLYPGEEAFEFVQEYYDDQKQEDSLWMARTGLDYDSLCGAIETLIFMSDKPLAITKIRNLIDEELPLRVVHQSLERLMEGYEEKHHGLRLVEVADGYQFRTKATYSRYVQDLFKVNALVLTPSALEVLAIIAYRQPVSKVEVDRIRGVDSGHIVRVLMDKRLVKVVGRSDEVGRPVLYGTTPEFLEVFNLPNIDQLPPESELEALATDKKKEISEIKSIVAEGDKAKFVFDEIEELDQLSESIKAISADTEFTKTIKGNDEEKSAFDILEEFLGKEVTTKFNQEAVESELVNSAFDPKVISDLTAGPFNLPEEEEEFEMIDLDTGEPIEADAIAEFNELFGDSDDEEIELDKALDDAFEKLTGEKLEALDELVEEVEETAKDLDLDLSFLKGESNQNSELDEPTDLQ